MLKFDIQLFADGKVVIETDLDKKGFESGLNKMQSIAKTGFSAVATAVGVASTAITGLVVASTKAYADYEQLVGGVDTLFKESSKKLQEYADQAYKTAGMSANEYMSTVTSFSASLLQSLGNDTEKSTEYANQAVIDMSDNANKMGTSMEMIQNAYQGFAKQNYTMLDNLKLGYGGTKTEMERLIADANKVKEANGEMADLSIDSFADVTEAIHIIQTEMGITGTTAKEADETISGSFNSMKASWENLMVAMADPDANMSTVIDQFMESVKTFGENLIPIVEEALLGVAELVNTLLPPILNTLPTLLNELLPVIIQAGANLLTALVNGISANMGTLVPTILNCIMIIANTILENLPMILELGMELIIQLMLGIADKAPELVPQIVDIIIKMLEIFNEHFDEFMAAGIQLILGLIKGLIKSIPTILDNLPTILMAMINFFTASKLISAGTSLIRGLGNGLINGIPDLIRNIPTIIKNLINSFKTNGLGAFKDIGTQLIKGLWSGISSAKDWLIDKIGGFTSSVVNAFKDFFGIHSPSRLMKDEVGKFVAQGVGVGFEDEIDSVYKDMQKAIDLETEKMSANVQTGSIYNKVMNTTPVQVNGSYTSKLEVNGEVLAEVVNDVNEKKDLQYMF